MPRTALAGVMLTCSLAALACALPATEDVAAVQTGVAATLTSIAPAIPAATSTPEPTPAPTPLAPRLWKSFSSGGNTGWWLENGTASEVTLPVDPGQYYDYNPLNGKILYASHFAASGAGPGNLAVSDLWMVDYPAGTPAPLIEGDSVVEALWAPDGTGFVYIGATPTTYELRYRSLAGEDRLLASNVSPTWGVSRTGAYVAFTRETGYDVPGDPGLYVVPMAGGPETKISDADRHGAGGIGDQPSWSFDDELIALPNWGFAPGAMVVAARDGSFTGNLTVAEPLAVNPIFGSGPAAALWHPDNQSLAGLANYAEGMGGPSPLVDYQLDASRLVVVGGEVLGQGYAVIDWNVPGQSFFALDPDSQVILVMVP